MHNNIIHSVENNGIKSVERKDERVKPMSTLFRRTMLTVLGAVWISKNYALRRRLVAPFPCSNRPTGKKLIFFIRFSLAHGK